MNMRIPPTFSYFPVKDKKPLVDWSEYMTRLPTPDELKEWEAKYPNYQKGIVTGGISKLLVLDDDGGLPSDYKIPSTLTAKTPRGGTHYYFRLLDELEDRVTTKVGILPKVDVRGEGGYVVFYGFTKPYQIQTLAPPPQWLVDLLPNKHKDGQVLGNDRDWLVDALDSLTLGNRNSTFASVVGRLWRKGLGIPEIRKLLLPYAVKSQFPIFELQTILNSISRYEQEGQIELRSFQRSAEEYKKRIQERGQFKEPELSTGFMSLDAATWGLRRGDILTIGARTGIGKTCLCISIAANLCKQGKRVMYVSTEMSFDEIFDRFIAVEANINTFNLSNGNLSAEDKVKLEDFFKRSKSYDFHIFDGLEPTIESLKDVISEIKPDVVFIDHLQHMSSGDNQVRELERLTKSFKQIAKEFNCAMVVASQLNRSVGYGDTRQDSSVPQLHHLKGCGSIEEESSQVLLLSRTGPDNDEELASVIMHLAKNRHGKTNFIQMQLNRPYTRFEELQ